MEKYSVLMTVYKNDNPEYFSLALDSMINQTYSPNEIVIVKDGPIINELQKVIDNCIANGIPIIQVQLPTNRGLGIALNEGIKAVKNELIARMDLVHHTDTVDSSNHLYLTRIPGITEAQRNELIVKLAEAGVTTNVHYKPLPMMTAYGKDCSDYPNAYDYYHNLIILPLHTLLGYEDVEYVCEVMKEVLP